MNSLTIRECFLAWLLLFLPSMFCGNGRFMEDKDPYQRAKYHIQGLRSSLEEIEQTHTVYKRSTDQEKQDDIVNSLAFICSKLHNKSHESLRATSKDDDKDKNKQNENRLLSTTVSPNPTIAAPNEMSSTTVWTMPTLLPVRVEAERIDGQDKVNVTFDVMHLTSFSAVRVYSFDYINNNVSQVNNSNPEKISKVQFFIDATYCRLNPSRTRDAEFVFMPQDNYIHGVSASVDICRFDKLWNKNRGKNGNKLEWKLRDEKIIKQDFTMIMPRYKLRSDIGDDFYIKRGEDPVFEIDAYLCDSCTFFVSLLAWDWESNTEFSDSAVIKHSHSEKKRLKIKNDRHNGEKSTKTFLKIDILREIVVNDSVIKDLEENVKQYAETIITTRVTVEIGSRQISGKLWLSYNWRQRGYRVRPVVRRMSWEREISLRLPYKITTFPRDYVYISAHDNMCNEKYMDNEKDCFAECHAWGIGLKNVFIVKIHPYRPPYKSVTYVLKGRSGFAKQNVGPVAEADTEGTFKCIVLLKNGEVKSKVFNVYTTRFTNLTNTFVEEFANGTSKVECTGTGAHPLNMSVIAMDNSQKNKYRLDNKPENKVFLETVGETTNLTLFLSTNQLKYPYYYVKCVAKGERGMEEETIYLPSDIENHNTRFPKILRNESSINVLNNGSTIINCTAAGQTEDMDMMVSYRARSSQYRIDHNAGNARTTTETIDRKYITLILPTASIQGPTSWLYCGAKNEFGKDWMDFYLGSYGVFN